MDRKMFLTKTILATAAGAAMPLMLNAGQIRKKNSDYDLMLDQVGFNHLPNKENKTMNTILHKAETRGHANHGWLDSYHTFSFANYRNPDRMHFGVLRVLNDDRVAAGQGFGTHPHDNMEIISIPLEGDLEHKDSMGNVAIIKEGDIQVMSAGTGIFHSEFNKNKDREVKFLQIWLFPNKKNVTPRYDQLSIKEIGQKNRFYQVLSPNAGDQGVWIHQDAWFSMGNFESGKTDSYQIKKTGNGVYAFVIDGEVEINGQHLEKRDGLGMWDTSELSLKSLTDSRVLLMDVPMTI
ncbi:MAG: pirin family protein [Bacteroidales bacterium]|nr:pirin family protein [Bacteroidales bacterium]